MKLIALLILLLQCSVLYSQKHNTNLPVYDTIINTTCGNIIYPSIIANGFAILDAKKAKFFSYRKFLKNVAPTSVYYDSEKAEEKLKIISNDGVVIRTLRENVVINIETMEVVTTKRVHGGTKKEPELNPTAVIVNGFAIFDSTKATSFINKFSSFMEKKKRYYTAEEATNNFNIASGNGVVKCTLKEGVIIDIEKLELIVVLN